MSIMEMTKKELQAIENSRPTEPFSGFIIVPTGEKEVILDVEHKTKE